MVDLPFGFTFDWNTALSGISLAVIGGWIASAFGLRKDERAVQIDQITRERTKWRDTIRRLTEDIVTAYFDNELHSARKRAGVLRARLITLINPKDDPDDRQIVAHFDELFGGSKSDIDIFAKRIAMLLKHDWERVKWESMPIYMKVFLRWSAKQTAWRDPNYRRIDEW